MWHRLRGVHCFRVTRVWQHARGIKAVKHKRRIIVRKALKPLQGTLGDVTTGLLICPLTSSKQVRVAAVVNKETLNKTKQQQPSYGNICQGNARQPQSYCRYTFLLPVINKTLNKTKYHDTVMETFGAKFVLRVCAATGLRACSHLVVKHQ